jgi:two-component system, NarL family, sensor histidine kinase UhpB
MHDQHPESSAVFKQELDRANQLLEETEIAAGIGSFTFGIETKDMYWSKGLYRIYESETGSFIPSLENVSSIFSLGVIQFYSHRINELLLLGKGFNAELEVSTARGTRIWIEIFCRAKTEAGITTHIFGTVQEITKRKQVENELRNSEQLYHAIFERNRAVKLLIDRSQGAIIDANSAAVDFYGYSLAELKSLKIAAINVCPIEQIRAEVNDAGNQGRPYFNFRHRLASGEIRDVEVYTSPIEIGGRVLLQSIIHDVSERKRAEEDLRRSEEKWRTLVTAIPDYVSLLDAEGRFLFLNHFAKGFSENDLEGKSFKDFMPEESQLIYDTAFQNAQRTGSTQHIEYKAFGDNYALTDYEGIVVPMYELGRMVNTMVIARDITDRKIIESGLQRSNEQLHLLSDHLQTVRENERTAIAREVHDELGQLFTALKMEVMALLRRDAAGGKELSPNAYSIMQMIDSGIRSVQELSSRLRPRILDDLGLITAIIWETEQFQRRTGIRVSLDLPREDVVIEKEMSTAVFRIMQESMTNIMRHAAATQTSISLRFEPGELLFSITDNGKGISEDRIADTNSLGLIGIRERLRALRGKVEFTNNDHAGMCVCVTIPRSESNLEQS